MTLPSLLRLSYWFDLTPPPFIPAVDRALLVTFSLLLVAGIIVGLGSMRHGWEKMTKKAIQRASGMLIVLGALGLLLYGLTYERIYVLSMRFGYFLWVLLLAWYAWKMYRLVRIEIPELERRRAEREQMNKWLPKSKA